MEMPFALHGHSRSVSSLATIVPISLDLRQWSASSPPRLASGPLNLPNEFTIPLPPSIPGSEYGGDAEPEDQPDPTHASGAHPALGLKEPVENIVETEEPYKPVTKFEEDLNLGRPQGQKDSPLTDEPPAILSSMEPLALLPTPIVELLDLIERDNHEREHFKQLQNQTLTRIHLCGNNNRTMIVKHHLYRRMVECFRAEKKSSFASLYSQSLSLKRESRIGVGHPNVGDTDAHAGRPRSQYNLAPWFTSLSSVSRQSLLDFLHNLRHQSTYLADRLAALGPTQLALLVQSHRPLESGSDPQSIGGRFNLRNLHQRQGKFLAEQTRGPSAMLQDPLLLLVHGLFDITAPWGSSEKKRQLEVWSSACAQIIQDAKPGANDFCLSVLDIFAEIHPWELQPRLELLLQELMQTGYFIVDPQTVQESISTVPIEIHNARLATRTSEFFDSALTKLTNLITESASSGIPQAAADLIHHTLRKIHDPDRRNKARSFFASRWYCTSFLSNAILHPERHRLLLRTHVSASIRHRIFRELAVRLQKALYRALSPQNSVTDMSSLEADERGQKLLALFEPPSALWNAEAPLKVPVSKNDCQFLHLGASDVQIIAQTLFPSVSGASSKELARERPISMASSYTESTTLTAGTNGLMTGTSSSAAPSISGTSVTSTTLSGDFTFNNFDKGHGSSKTIESPLRFRMGALDNFFQDVEDYQAPSFEMELAMQLQKTRPKAVHSFEESLILYVRGSDGSLHLDINDIESTEETSELAKSPIFHTISVPSPSSDMLGQAFYQASLARKSLNPTELYLVDAQPESVNTLFKRLLSTCLSSLDFKSAHFWSRSLEISESLTERNKIEMINQIAENYRDSIQTHKLQAASYHTWLLSLDHLQYQQDEADRCTTLHHEALRDKMWYVSDAKHSSTYEDAMNLIRALKSMANPASPKQSGVAAWARQRFRTQFGQDRVQHQVLDAISVPTEKGGPNKLSDKQADLVLSWLNRESVENFCKGEERIHRFCFEIQKFVKRLVGENIFESPVLWTSILYQNEREWFQTGNGTVAGQAQQDHLVWTTNHVSPDAQRKPNTHLQTQDVNTGLGVSFAAPTYNSFPTGNSREAKGSVQDPGIFLTPPRAQSDISRDWTLPPSPVSPVINKNIVEAAKVPRAKFVEKLRQSLTALFLSEVGLQLWAWGSETDLWMNSENTPTAFRYAYDEHVKLTESRSESVLSKSTNNFSFEESYKLLVKRFQLSFDPFTKLDILVQLTELAALSIQSDLPVYGMEASSPLSDSTLTRGVNPIDVHTLGLPRTRLTRLEEVVANCKERRLMSMGLLPATNGTFNPSNSFNTNAITESSIAIVRAFIVDSRYRPSTLYRDLQMIAAFVPGSVLDGTSKGTTFWDIGIAAMNLKSETCRLITGRAGEILAYHLNTGNTREPIRSDNSGSTSPFNEDPRASMSQEDLARTSLQDAVRLYTISALEGDPTAARELGLLYLTHPELVRRVTLPLAKTGEVFRLSSALSSGDRGRPGDGRLDPATFAVAFHWMEFAANAGDEDAKTFLRENTELGNGL